MLDLVVHIGTTGLKSRQYVSCLADLLGGVWLVSSATAVSDTGHGTAITLLLPFESRDQGERRGRTN
jgi:hypothetical protein